MMISRSTRGVGVGFTVGALVAAPVLLAAGGWLLAWGSAEGQRRAVVTFDTSIKPVAAIAVIAGAVITVAGIGVSRWSPWALVIPALTMLLVSLLFVISMSVPDFRKLIPFELLRIGMPFVIVGGAVAAAVAQLAFTPVAVIVSRRARRNAASVPAAAYGTYPVEQYPPADSTVYPPPPAPPAT